MLPEQGKCVLLLTVGISGVGAGGGVALQKEGSKSGAIGAKGLCTPGGTTQTHPGSRAEATGQIFGQGPARTREELGQTVVPPAWVQRLHLSVRSCMTLSNFLKLCRLASLSVRWGS